VAGRDVFMRGAPNEQALVGDAPLAEVPLFALVDAFQRVLDRTKLKLTHDIVADRVSITERIAEVSAMLVTRRSVTFDEMFESLATKFELVITFLALLEMTRLKMTRLRQDEALGPLHIELTAAVPDAEPPTNTEAEKP
jgi:segregation and condensation protein A